MWLAEVNGLDVANEWYLFYSQKEIEMVGRQNFENTVLVTDDNLYDNNYGFEIFKRITGFEIKMNIFSSTTFKTRWRYTFLR